MPKNTERLVKAWDVPTRLFHWTLVVCLASAWFSFEFAERIGDPTLRWHRYNGYAILILLVFRILWGIFGSSTSRWRSFVTWPWTAIGYGLDLLRGKDRHFLGHNPLGTYMILALLAVVSVQGILGLFVVEHNDTSWGPLYKLATEETQKLVTSWHLWIFKRVILPLVALHIIANTLYGLVKKDPLIRAMVTGKKPAANYEDGAEVVVVTQVWQLAALCLAVATVIVLGGIKLAGGKLFY